MKLHNLQPSSESKHRKKRVGRGVGSGRGKTSTRGQKGQLSRSGSGIRPGFEGGQMPLIRRLPKRGFTNIFSKEYAIVNVGDLNGLEKGSEVSAETLKEMGKIKKIGDGLKVLGNGDLTVELKIKATKVSAGAKEKIEKAGGSVEVIG